MSRPKKNPIEKALVKFFELVDDPDDFEMGSLNISFELGLVLHVFGAKVDAWPPEDELKAIIQKALNDRHPDAAFVLAGFNADGGEDFQVFVTTDPVYTELVEDRGEGSVEESAENVDEER